MNEEPAEAREEAQRILSEGRFNETELPRPLRGVLGWLGDRLQPIGDLVDRALPGGDNVVWLLLAAVVLVLALVFATTLVGRRGPGAERRSGRARVESTQDAGALEREADAAELVGDLELALRLRFGAGVLRLAERRQLDDPSSITTGALVRRFRSDAFAAGARSFDEVVYGRRPPTPDDARRVREAWEAVLAR
ncbi:MAG: DUF4129 domain-containing protein [Actinomycetota bacterium]|nr:DUF4129 domain-containing protein [Actinomycetota bacterium]